MAEAQDTNDVDDNSTEDEEDNAEQAGNKCDFPGCGRSFSSQNYLKTHFMKEHADEDIYSCPVPDCEEHFTTSYRRVLINHLMSSKHGVQLIDGAGVGGAGRHFSHSELKRRNARILYDYLEGECSVFDPDISFFGGDGTKRETRYPWHPEPDVKQFLIAMCAKLHNEPAGYIQTFLIIVSEYLFDNTDPLVVRCRDYILGTSAIDKHGARTVGQEVAAMTNMWLSWPRASLMPYLQRLVAMLKNLEAAQIDDEETMDDDVEEEAPRMPSAGNAGVGKQDVVMNNG